MVTLLSTIMIRKMLKILCLNLWFHHISSAITSTDGSAGGYWSYIPFRFFLSNAMEILYNFFPPILYKLF